MDLYFFQIINQFALKWFWLDVLGVFFASYLQYAIIISLLLFPLINFRKYWTVIFLSLFSAVFSRIFIEAIYLLYPKARPFEIMDVNQLVSHSASHAFPSGHATFFFALATIIFLQNKKAGSIYLLAAFLISFARVFSGIHWPVDLVGGAVVGGVISIIFNFIYNKLKNNKNAF